MLWACAGSARDRRQLAGRSHFFCRDLCLGHFRPARGGAAPASPSPPGRRDSWRDRDRHGGRDRCTTADLHAGSPRHERADGARLLDLRGRRRARAATRMGCDRLCPELYTLHRLVRRHLAAHPVRSGAVRINLCRSDRIPRPQPSSVCHRQLYRTTGSEDCGFGLPFHGAVCGVLLGHALGHSRRIHRRADPDHACNRLRQVSSLPPDRSPSGRAGCSSRIGRRVWKYLRIAKHAAAAAKCFRVCPLNKFPTE